MRKLEPITIKQELTRWTSRILLYGDQPGENAMSVQRSTLGLYPSDELTFSVREGVDPRVDALIRAAMDLADTLDDERLAGKGPFSPPPEEPAFQPPSEEIIL